jgi:hypothetical protein
VFMLLGLLTQAARENECTKALPMPIRKALQNELCGPSSPGHIGPAQCATISRKVSPSWQVESVAQLCRDAQSAAPASCVGAFKLGTPIEVTIDLCSPLKSDVMYNDSAISGPADCFSASPRGWPVADTAWLCQGSLSEPDKSPPLSAQCATEAMKNNHFRSGTASPLAASLCQGSVTPFGALECALAATDALNVAKKAKYSTAIASSESLLTQLCRGASSDWAGKCYTKASSSNSAKLTDADKVTLCRNAVSLAPATCALSKSLSKLDPKIRVALCSSSSDDIINHDDNNGVDTSAGVAACAEAAFPMFSRNGNENALLVSLCLGATGSGPTQCLSKAPLTIDMPSRVKLCRGAEDDGPAKCFKAIRTLRVSFE